jgi:hypothetical protein
VGNNGVCAKQSAARGQACDVCGLPLDLDVAAVTWFEEAFCLKCLTWLRARNLGSLWNLWHVQAGGRFYLAVAGNQVDAIGCVRRVAGESVGRWLARPAGLADLKEAIAGDAQVVRELVLVEVAPKVVQLEIDGMTLHFAPADYPGVLWREQWSVCCTLPFRVSLGKLQATLQWWHPEAIIRAKGTDGLAWGEPPDGKGGNPEQESPAAPYWGWAWQPPYELANNATTAAFLFPAQMVPVANGHGQTDWGIAVGEYFVTEVQRFWPCFLAARQGRQQGA